MANRACNGRDKNSVKYGPMCYATCEDQNGVCVILTPYKEGTSSFETQLRWKETT